ncbi:MAG: carbohydrate-binding family 6 protein [Acidobacteriota bacterium]
MGWVPLSNLAAADTWSLLYDHGVPEVRFAASEIRRACVARHGSLVEEPLDRLADVNSPVRLVIAAGPAASARVAGALGLKPAARASAQSYSIRRLVRDGRTTMAVLGADAAGAMYGGLDLAEAIRWGALDAVRDADHSPHIERRGIKFNIPLDVRTPSYSDNSHAAQNNIPEMWSFDFWREFLDEMARHRFNVLTLWNLHPFPSLVKAPEFPEVALDDVKRTRVPMDDTYSGSGSDMVRPELLENVETVKKLAIGEKIQFWRDVMQHARDRGIEVYWFTWNLFTWGAEGKHGITPDQTNPKTIEYFRASIREMVLTYPLLAGFGITAGERMQSRADEFSKEKWLWKAYGEGVADAKKVQPHRNIRMIHRYHQTGHDEIQREWKDYPGTLDLSFKYSIAHMYSIPNPPFLQPALSHLSPSLRTWLTVRDDDYYSFRWGDPEYARAFIRNIPGPDKVAGYYMGPDGYIWGREFLSTEPESPRQLVIGKRWYAFMIWGRLSYDPNLPDDLFQRSLAARFPEVPAGTMFRAWAAASKIFPQITRFFWGDIDVRWFPEACLSHPRHRGFYTVQHFIEGETMPGSGILDIVEWRRRKLAGEPLKAVGPLEVADALAGHAAEVLRLSPELRRTQGSNKELRLTLGDLAAMAHLGNYYAAKIRGAAELALFDRSGAPAQREAAVRHLQAALEHWKRYAAAYTLQYEQPRLYNRVGWVDIPALTARVEQDIAIARLWAPGTVPDKPAAPRAADMPFRK